MALFSWLNWTVNDWVHSVQAAEDEGGWQTDGLCSDWRIVNAQLLYHRNRLFWYFGYVRLSVTGSFTSALHLVLSTIHSLLLLVKCTRKQCMSLKCNNSSAVSAKLAEMQFASGHSYTYHYLANLQHRKENLIVCIWIRWYIKYFQCSVWGLHSWS